MTLSLAEQGIAVFFGPIGQMCDEVFNLFAGGFTQALRSAEVGRVGLDQRSIESMLAGIECLRNIRSYRIFIWCGYLAILSHACNGPFGRVQWWY